MESEHKAWSVVSVSAALFLMTLCFVAKGCNESNNIVTKAAVEKGCTVLRSGSDLPHIICK